MRHRTSFNRLGRKPAHRRALYRSMTTALFRHERIRTTVAKAREVRRVAERMITRAREDTVHNRRLIARSIQDRDILAKLFTDIAPRFAGRPGGYTRVLKLGRRQGDSSEMAVIELVVRTERRKKRRKKPEEGKAARGEAAGAEAESRRSDSAEA